MKKILSHLVLIIILTSCQKEITREQLQEEVASVSSNAKGQTTRMLICHNRGNGSWQLKNIFLSDWAEHMAHGDVRLDDQDKDGYVPDNACGYGQMGDCDDLNPTIYAGAPELCNGIDENCNGEIDENCIANGVVTIGNQTWMAKNLDVVTYRDGTPIPQITDITQWITATTGAWCYYQNNSANGTTYGKLYNWFAVSGDSDGDGIKDKELAPWGFHIPTNAEYITLADYLGGATVAGGKMKTDGTAESGTSLWLYPNAGATNSSGFSALPGGLRRSFGSFYGISFEGIFWTSDEPNSEMGYARYLMFTDSELFGADYDKHSGLSVRCVKN